MRYGSILIILGLVFVYLRGNKPHIFKVEAAAPQTMQNYEHVSPWPQQRADLNTAAGSGVAVDAQGHVFLLHRAGHDFNNTTTITEPTVVEYEPTSGAIVATWGANIFQSPHGIAIDSADNVWITDVMTNKVYKFSHSGELLLTLGAPYYRGLETCLRIRNELTNLPCIRDPYLFARPTDIAPGPDGTIYVSDGYRNSRVAVFDQDGTYLRGWGTLGDAPGEFSLPHGIAMDAAGLIYVADRRNARIQVFDGAGQLKDVWQSPELGRPFGVEVGPDGAIYVIDGSDQIDDPSTPARSQIIKLDHSGKIVERWGWYADEPETNDIGHDIAVGLDGSIYVARLTGPSIQKFAPQP